ncbi:hypothetical protein [Litoreibacter roseus]|uniref:Uncharacterized protein n=1 Tax=Litoreibacter roseus TaxID=2601869 RepID=A0A6N6JCM1_9RHOB|nr:hypothetical protein [Litoreibacter roseus]GFE63906.1 hypothetical protein KIN_09800 [Litoreibacter roseus]
MADNNSSGSFMPFIVGALVVVVGIMGYFMFIEGGGDEPEIQIDLPGSSD